MDRKTAQALMAAYKRIGEVMNEADGIIRTLPENERSKHLRGLGDMMGDLWFKLQLPVVSEHRDIDPDGDRLQKKLTQEQ
ncbi:hypothetical protein LK540_19320 [Massilia sp. IC2-278]|uniref:hypothetical protein n=1 Tax=Massilia sp. IC2-278 TaxID=2887200 RepID=UPI001E57161E|nr:hypothetical protein [Massilia sp. IC2-278]MCC2962582.1 hypothetical protein [Massilia sp. IC2-278]